MTGEIQQLLLNVVNGFNSSDGLKIHKLGFIDCPPP